MIQRYVSWSVIAFITVLGIIPILFMLKDTFFDAQGFSLLGYQQLLKNKSLWHSFQNSLILAFSVAFSATLIGTFLGILLSKTSLTLRYVWFILLSIPLLIPPYILAYSWYALLGRESYFGTLLFGFWGSFFILFCVYLPIVILLISLFLRQINPRLEEAGLLVCPWFCVLSKVTLPLLKPAILFSFILVFILSIGELSVANFLRFDIFPMESFVQFSAFYDFKTATLLTMPLLLIVAIILSVESHFLSKKNLHLRSYMHPLTIPLGKLRRPLLGTVMLLCFVIVILPLIGLLQQITTESFIHAFSKASPALTRSIFYASLGATLLSFFGFLTAYIVVNKTTKGWKFLRGSVLFLFVISSIVIGLALILFWNTPTTNFIYTTPLIILIGYLIKYLFLSSEIIALKLSEIPQTYLEAAKLTGASHRAILWYILLPLAKDSLIIAWIIGFIFSLRESTITMLVTPAGYHTLPLYIFTQMANGKESTIASLCLMMIIATLLPLFALLYYHKKTKGSF
ncbi:MAG: hypothetical protein DSZ12_05405 [Sulfurovum sp.]|nr:MAG: hypothetical protein DSZ12_05405 [Sulfurovum sp.]